MAQKGFSFDTMIRAWRIGLFVLICGVAAYFKTYPLARDFSNRIPFSPQIAASAGDQIQEMWILAWDYHALTTDPRRLFHAHIFYPVRNTLAFGEPLLGILPVFALPYALTRNPVLAYNVVFFASFLLSGLSCFFLAWGWTRNFWASAAAGFLFAFSPLRMGKIDHLQFLNLYWTPLALLFLDRNLRRPAWGTLLAFALFFWLQMLTSIYLAWFTLAAVLLYAGGWVWLHRAKFSRRRRLLAVQLAAFLLSTLAVLLPFFYPYVQARREWGFSRTVGECVNSSADLLSFLNVAPLAADFYHRVLRFASDELTIEKWLFPGLILPLLVLFGFLARRHRGQRLLFLILLLVLVILSFGPFLVVAGRNTHIPLPYLFLYKLVPGWSAMRAPARFAFMAHLFASLLAAYGFVACASFLSRHARASRKLIQTSLGLFVMAGALLELGSKSLPLRSLPVGNEIPEVYRWLARERPGPIAEVPGGIWHDDHPYLYYGTLHWLPLANGASAFHPATYTEISEVLDSLPSEAGMSTLGLVGLRALVLHSSRLSPAEKVRWERFLAAHPERLLAAFGEDRVLALPAERGTRGLLLESTIPSRLPSFGSLTFHLSARGEGGLPWVHPPPFGMTEGFIRLVKSGQKKVIKQGFKLRLPLVIPSGVSFPLDVPFSPPPPGSYSVQLAIPGFSSSTKAFPVHFVSRVEELPAEGKVSAAYRLEGEPAPFVLGSLPLYVRLINRGEAAWRPNGNRATILVWRWRRAGRMVREGGSPLNRSVLPGQEVDLPLLIPAPSNRGAYELKLELLRKPDSRFSEFGVEPLHLSVNVLPRLGDPFEEGLIRQIWPTSSPPRLRFRATVMHEKIRLAADVLNPGQARTLDWIMALRFPDGGRAFFNPRVGFVPEGGGPAVPFAREFFLSPGNTVSGQINLDRNPLPEGTYHAYAVLAESGSRHILSLARTSFSLSGKEKPRR